jgi:hypothetical protein
MTLIGKSTNAANQGQLWVWGLANPTAGTNAFVISASTQIAAGGAIAYAVSGTSTTAPFGTSVNHYSTSGGVNSLSITTTAANSLAFGVEGDSFGPTSITVTGTVNGSSTTLTSNTRTTTQSSGQMNVSTQAVTSVGTVCQQTWNNAFNNQALVMFEIVAGGAAGTTLSPTGRGSTVAFGTAVVARDTKIVRPVGLTSTAALGSARVQNFKLQATGISSTATFGAATVTRANVVYWDSAHTDTDITLSNTSLIPYTATKTATTHGHSITVANTPVVPGQKNYWEITVGATAVSLTGIGIVEANPPLTSAIAAFNSTGVVWTSNGNTLSYNAGLPSRETFTAGDKLSVLVDTANGWLFFGKNGVYTNASNNSIPVNFADGTGAATTISTSLNFYPALDLTASGDAFTANFGRTSFTYTVPTGYSGLDAPPAAKTISPSGIAKTNAFGTATVAFVGASGSSAGSSSANGIGSALASGVASAVSTSQANGFGAALGRGVASAASTSQANGIGSAQTRSFLYHNFSRASTATFYDSTGTLQDAGIDQPRYGYDGTTLAYLGLLVEPASTNSASNPRGEGAVAGSPGSAPTTWSLVSAGGLTRQIVGTGTINGIQYVDVRYSGTATVAGNLITNFNFNTAVAESVGQVWSGSYYFAVVSDTSQAPQTSYAMYLTQTGGTTSYLKIGTFNTNLSSFISRTATGTLNSASVTGVTLSLWSNTASSVLNNTYDVTLRLGYPQLELGSSITSIILPPVGSPGVTTRAADIVTVPSTASGVGAPIDNTTGSAASTSTCSGGGSSTASSIGASSATSQENGTGSAQAFAVGTCVAASGTSAFGISQTLATGSSSSTSADIGAGSSTAFANATSSGTSTATAGGFFQGLIFSVGTAASSSVSTGIGSAVTSAVAYAQSPVWARASAATYYDGTNILLVPADVKRVDASLGVLVEVASAQSFLNSNAPGFANQGTGSVVQTSDLPQVFKGAAVFKHTRTQTSGDTNTGALGTPSLVNGVNYAGSFWIYIPSAFSGTVGISQEGGGGNGGTITTQRQPSNALRDQWQRVWVVKPSVSTSTTNIVLRINNTTAPQIVYTTCWQWEQASSATSYMPTDGINSFSRAADIPSIDPVFYAQVLDSSTGTSPGASGSLAAGSCTANAAGSSATSSTASAAGAPTSSAGASSVCASTASAIGSSRTQSIAACATVSTASATGSAQNQSTGTTVALSTATGIAAALDQSVGGYVTTAWTDGPGFLASPQVFASRASPATYFDSTGTLQSAPSDTARDNSYSWNGSSWVANSGTLVEAAATNWVPNNSSLALVVLANSTELAANSNFASGSTGWSTSLNGGTGSVSFTGGVATLTGDGTHAASIYQSCTTSVSASGFYIVTVIVGAGANLTLSIGTSAGNTNLGTATLTAGTTNYVTHRAIQTPTFYQVNNTSTTATTVSLVSVQLGGRPPTSWSASIAPGVAAKVIGSGTQNGIPYIDYNVTGSLTGSTLSLNLYFSGYTQIPAVVGQTWTASFFAAVTSGTPGSYIQIETTEVNSSGTAIAYRVAYITNSINATLSPFSYTFTVGNAATAYLVPSIWIGNTGGPNVVNYTLRIGLPQLEMASGATSPIFTTSGASTRAADYLTAPVIGGQASVAGVGAATTGSSATSAASSTANGLSVATTQAVGVSSGSGTAIATGAATANSAATSAGSGAASGICSGIGESSGSSICSSFAPATGTSAATTSAVSVGTSPSVAIGSSTASSVGSSTSTSSAIATSISICSAVGNATGSSPALADAAANTYAVGTVATTSQTIATGAGLAATTASATGSSSSSGVGSSTSRAVGAISCSSAAVATSTNVNTLRATGIAKSNTFGLPTERYIAAATSLASHIAFGSPTICRQVKPSGIASTIAFGVGSEQTTILTNAILSSGGIGAASVTWRVTPAAIAATSSLGASRVLAGGYITPSGLQTTSTFGLSSVQSVIKTNGIASTAQFGLPQIATGSVSVYPSGIESSATVGQALFSAGGVLRVIGIASSTKFGNATVLRGGVTAQPTGIHNVAGFGAASVSGRNTVSVAGIAPKTTVGTAAIIQHIVGSGIHPTNTFGFGAVQRILRTFGVAASNRFGSSRVGSISTVQPPGLARTSTIGVPTLHTVLQPTGIASTGGFGASTVVPGRITISSTGTQSTNAFGLPVFVAGGILRASGIGSTARFGQPVVNAGYVSLMPSGIGSTLGIGSPDIAVGYKIVPTGLLSALAFGSAVVSGRNTLALHGISATGAIGVPTLSCVALLGVTGIGSTSQVDPALVSSRNTIEATGIAASDRVGAATISINGAIAVTGMPSVTAIGNHTIASRNTIIVDGLQSSNDFGSLSITSASIVRPPSLEPATNIGTFTVRSLARGNVGALGIHSTSQFGTALVSATNSISVEGIPASSAIGAHTVSSQAAILPDGLDSTTIVGIPDTTNLNEIQVSGIGPAADFGLLTIATAHADYILPEGMPSASVIGQPAVSQQVLAVGIQSTSRIGNQRLRKGVMSLKQRPFLTIMD